MKNRDVTHPRSHRKIHEQIADKIASLRERVSKLEMDNKAKTGIIKKLKEAIKAGSTAAMVFVVAMAMVFAMAVPVKAEKEIRQKYRFMNLVNIEKPLMLNDIRYTFPSTDSAGALVSDGSGTLSWGLALGTTRTMPFLLGAAMVDSTGPITAATAPNLATLDNIHKILWDSSAETTGVQWTFRVPADYASGGGVYALVSTSDTAGSVGVCGTSIALDYMWWINGDEVAFDASEIGQGPLVGLNPDSDTSHELFDLSANATAQAAFTAGAWVTFELFNSADASGVSCGATDTEVAGVEFYYNASQ